MASLLVLACLAQHAFAQNNSTALVGWQTDGDTRSSWDIVWTCLSTILACTWNILHVNVRLDDPNILSSIRKLLAWLVATLAPEIILMLAADELYAARSTASMCNLATMKRTEREEGARKAESQTQARPADVDADPDHIECTIAQGFCINMHGLFLMTRDNWLYPIRQTNVEALIEAGVLPSVHFTDRDVTDRAKADSFAKAFAVLQSSWVVCNIVARAAYRLPISPIELATVAYVACAVLIYAMWWHKPKDMTTPIMIPLPYSRDSEEMPREVRAILDTKPKAWVPMRVPPRKVTPSLIARALFPGTAAAAEDNTRGSEPAESDEKDKPARDQTALNLFSVFVALLFCGIHLAAWNFIFPTEAEKKAWRVFSLIAIAAPCVLSGLGWIPDFMRWLASKVKIPGMNLVLKRLGEPKPELLPSEQVILVGTLFVYMLARLGMFALMFSSLRALSARSYISIDWLASIPHI